RPPLRDFIRRASVPAGTVQRLFPDKEAILHTLVEDSARRLRARVRAARDRATSLEEFVARQYRSLFAGAAPRRVSGGVRRGTVPCPVRVRRRGPGDLRSAAT